jgi:putative hemolysin
MITFELIVILGLVLVNAFFALSEIAVVSASKPLLRQMARQGNKRAGAALALAENPGKFLSTVQVGITLVGILAGTYGGATIAEKITPWFDSIPFIHPHGETVAVTLIVTTLTFFSVVIGELIPKQFALSRAEKIAMLVARPMTIISSVCYPFVAIFQWFANSVMKVFGILGHQKDQMTEDELKAVISEGVESGAIEKSEHEMMQRIIRLGDRDVKSIMTHRQDVTFIDVNDTLEDIKTKIHTAGHSRYPVIDGKEDNVVGIIQAKDLLDDLLHTDQFHIRAYVRDAYVMPENSSCLSALESFKKKNINLIVIVDEYGSTQGIVTPSDILEAIVGIIPSNYDDGNDAMIVQRQDGSWLVDGLTPIEEIHLSVGLQDISADEDFDTIAGFVLETLRKAPKTGDWFDAFGYRFEIVDMDGRRIDKILIQKTKSQTSDQTEAA